MRLNAKTFKESPVPPRFCGYNWKSAKGFSPRIVSVTESICRPGFNARLQSETWTLDYSFTSFGLFKVQSIKRPWEERKAFEAHLYPPRVPYWEDTTTAQITRTRSIFINFTGGEKANLPALTGPHSYACFLDSSQRLGGLLERGLDTGLTLGEKGFWDAQGVFYEIIGLLFRSRHLKNAIYEIPGADHPAISGFVLAVHKYLNDNLAGRITRKLLAQHLNISVATLVRRYNMETGESPMTTLSAFRINVARALLLKGHCLKFIAAQTGFCDEYHLSRVFKKLVGVTPREFRNRTELT